ncbi:hypothetical protein H6F86_30925 [Phormidium sp. FACHB-592]|uniref:Uncharacterized protein n=1 Tax=Stenomitos frigidus AS-A4 TaxID=2933935 RepID=A0ABV0KRU1_9CYAN|nr:hypothetical protein [Phormidium sp. FACHB-592]MBD2078226.1 hypothetical protein [Phormidium sp. FACHB-592]
MQAKPFLNRLTISAVWNRWHCSCGIHCLRANVLITGKRSLRLMSLFNSGIVGVVERIALNLQGRCL